MSSRAAAAARQVESTRLRYGNRGDLAAISRLIHRANALERNPRIDERDLELMTGRGELIVLQLAVPEIAAAACIACGHGLVFLVIDPDIATPELEHRMIEVANALAESQQPAVGHTRRRR